MDGADYGGIRMLRRLTPDLLQMKLGGWMLGHPELIHFVLRLLLTSDLMSSSCRSAVCCRCSLAARWLFVCFPLVAC